MHLLVALGRVVGFTFVQVLLEFSRIYQLLNRYLEVLAFFRGMSVEAVKFTIFLGFGRSWGLLPLGPWPVQIFSLLDFL